MAKRRQQGDGSVYKRASDGMWIGSVEIGYVGTKRVRRTVSAKTQRGAQNKLKEVRDGLDKTGGSLAGASVTVKTWAEYWITEIAKPRLRPGTYTNYVGYVKNYVVPHLGKRKLAKLSPEDVRGMYATMATDGNTGVRPHVHRMLRKCLADALAEGKVTRNVAALTSIPSGLGGKRESMTARDGGRMLAASAGDRLASRWWAALLAGMRQGECLGLEWDRVDLDAATAEVSWQLDRIPFDHGCGDPDGDTYPCGKLRAGYCPDRKLRIHSAEYEHRQLDGGLCLTRPKSQAGWRMVPIVPSLVTSLRDRWDAYERERPAYACDHNLVWPRPDGTPIREDPDTTAWKQLCRTAGVPVVDLHAARNTTATMLMEAGVDVHVVEAILGHADAATSRGYQTVDLRFARESLQRVEQLYQIEA